MSGVVAVAAGMSAVLLGRPWVREGVRSNLGRPFAVCSAPVQPRVCRCAGLCHAHHVGAALPCGASSGKSIARRFRRTRTRMSPPNQCCQRRRRAATPLSIRCRGRWPVPPPGRSARRSRGPRIQSLSPSAGCTRSAAPGPLRPADVGQPADAVLPPTLNPLGDRSSDGLTAPVSHSKPTKGMGRKSPKRESACRSAARTTPTASGRFWRHGPAGCGRLR